MSHYVLPKLPFAYDALEPLMDEKTMKVHHDGHHRTYVEKLNDVMDQYPEFARPVDELLAGVHYLPKEIESAVCNDAGGHANHSLFWTLLTPEPQEGPTGEIEQAIETQFVTFSNFKEKFTEVAVEHFSNGWAWLAADTHGKLTVFSTKDHESPITRGMTPLLTLDLWEHAYYLKHQNRRPEFVSAFWKLVNWSEVGARWEDLTSKGATNREWRMAG